MAGEYDRAKSTVLRDLYGGGGAAARIAVCLDGARKTVQVLAEGISTVLPDFTDHSIEHIDSLWTYVELLIGPDRALNPAEAFVLAGAILLHDLAMTPVAYPDGFPGPKYAQEFRDYLAAGIRRREGRPPTALEIEECDPAIVESASRTLLRRHHADAAKALATRALFKLSEPDTKKVYIFEDSQLRYHFGAAIGQVAESHWWDLDQVERLFADRPALAAPIDMGEEWSVDLLELACLLRCADAAHLDSRRANSLRRHLQGPSSESVAHWEFQARITSVSLRDQALVYEAPDPFPQAFAAAWWLAYRTLRDVVDHELRACDQLLRKRGRPTLKANCVLGVESASRFVATFPTDGWRPVDAEIRVADTKRLIELLGGRQLYGNNPEVALRELVQNASDAVRARRALEETVTNSAVTIALAVGDGDEPATLTVSDNGIGMTERTVTDRLLVLGESLWTSDQVIEEHPGLMSTSFEATGRFGIGFFSLSMVANSIQVRTRPISGGVDKTIIVSLDGAFAGMPIIRDADRDEQRMSAGTDVTLILGADSEAGIIPTDGLSSRFGFGNSIGSWTTGVRRMFPMMDCDVRFSTEGAEVLTAEANDWLSLSIDALYERCVDHSWSATPPPLPDFVVTVTNELDQPVGRFGLLQLSESDWYTDTVLVTVGGILTNSIHNPLLFGLLRGSDFDLTRNRAVAELPATAAMQFAAAIAEWRRGREAATDDEIAVAASVEVVASVEGQKPDIYTRDGFVRWTTFIRSCLEVPTVVMATVDPTRIRPSQIRQRAVDFVVDQGTGGSATHPQTGLDSDLPDMSDVAIVYCAEFLHNIFPRRDRLEFLGQLLSDLIQEWQIAGADISAAISSFPAESALRATLTALPSEGPLLDALAARAGVMNVQALDWALLMASLSSQDVADGADDEPDHESPEYAALIQRWYSAQADDLGLTPEDPARIGAMAPELVSHVLESPFMTADILVGAAVTLLQSAVVTSRRVEIWRSAGGHGGDMELHSIDVTRLHRLIRGEHETGD